MPFSISVDLRIQFYEALLRRLEKYRMGGALRDKDGVLRRAAALMKEIAYSGLPPADIMSYYGERIDRLAHAIETLHVNETLRPFLHYVVDEFRDFRRKFSRSVREPFEVFRYAIVDIVSVSKHPTLKNLRITRVRDGRGTVYTVVTNLDVKEGQRAAVVFLPPREFDGVVSEAMFVKVGISGPEDISEEDMRELNKYFYEITSS